MRLFMIAVALMLVGLGSGADAQEYPSKMIKIIVPYPPGGTTDIIARLISSKMSDRLKQSVIVDNRPGAGGIIGTAAVAKSAPDGYTLDFGNLGPNAINQSVYTNLPYDAEKDFAPISVVAMMPLILVVPASVPVKSAQELIALEKSRPGQLNFASVGIGSVSHVAGELFNSMAGTKFAHVPYKGGAPAIVGMLAGEATMFFANPVEATTHIKSGRFRALGIASATRSPIAPDLPTVAESGLPGFEVTAWFGLLAPAATPRPIIDRLQQTIAAIVQQPEVRSRLLELSTIPASNTPDEFAVQVKSDIAKWAKVVKDTGVKVD